MASLTVGSNNFPTRVYENAPDLVDWLASEMRDSGVGPEIEAFDFFIETLARLSPRSEWCAAGIGASQIVVNEWCVASGGNARTGLEDNVRLDRGALAPSNAALVRRVVDLCEHYERPVATAAEARTRLGLNAAA